MSEGAKVTGGRRSNQSNKCEMQFVPFGTNCKTLPFEHIILKRSCHITIRRVDAQLADVRLDAAEGRGLAGHLADEPMRGRMNDTDDTYTYCTYDIERASDSASFPLVISSSSTHEHEHEHQPTAPQTDHQARPFITPRFAKLVAAYF